VSTAMMVKKLLLLSAVTLICACSTTQDLAKQEALQHAALARWNSCIERHKNLHDKPSINLHKVVKERCEGHQRDVVATYPIYLENQVNSLLSKRTVNMTTEHFLRSSNPATWNIRKSTHDDKLQLLSPSAQTDDL